MVAAEDVPRREESGAKVCLVVDFAVEQNADRLILVPHRLLAARDVDDGEAAESEMKSVFRLDMKTRAVRAAVDDRDGHRFEFRSPANADEAGQPAHAIQPGRRDGGPSKLISSRA